MTASVWCYFYDPHKKECRICSTVAWCTTQKKSTRRTNKPTHIFMDSKDVSHYKQVYPCVPSGMTSFFAAAEHGNCWSAHCATTWQLVTGNHTITRPKLEVLYATLVSTQVLCLLRSQSPTCEWLLSLLAFLLDWIFNAFLDGNIFIWIGSFSSISGIRRHVPGMTEREM